MQPTTTTTTTLPDELLPYKHRLTPHFHHIRQHVLDFITEVLLPNRNEYQKQRQENIKRDGELNAAQPPILKDFQAEAKKRGLWNLFLPEVCGLSVLEYAPIAEILGTFPLANIAMNCSAPDSGNMEVLEKFGTPEQRKQWLEPLLSGDIRSAFAMTEPGVASSDATQISTRIICQPDGTYSVMGHKWFISGAIRPECKVFLVVGKNRDDGPRHARQSMILVPRDWPGVKILRAMAVFGHEHDHAEMIFDCHGIPATNIILGEGRGFEIAQARLGPGRIHHCMRTIGIAEAALDAMVYRAKTRTAFGSKLSEKDSIRRAIAEARLSITANRQLCYLAAVMADEKGFKEARKYIAMIKVSAPRSALAIVDEAIQIHGAAGLAQDSQLTGLYTGLRTLRTADGSDSVHLNTIADMELSRKTSIIGRRISGVNKNIEQYRYLWDTSSSNNNNKNNNKKNSGGGGGGGSGGGDAKL
jgi:acyl-CoA dehydrogenase